MPFVLGIAQRRRIRNPEVDLEGAIALGAYISRPLHDRARLHQERATAPEASGIRYRNGESCWARARHRREQNGTPKSKPSTESLGPSVMRHQRSPTELIDCFRPPLLLT